MSHKWVKASKRTGRCTDTHHHLYVGVLSIEVGFGEVGEIVQIQQEGARTVSVNVAAFGPGQGQPVFWTRPAVFRSQLGRGAAFCIYVVLLRRHETEQDINLFLIED